MFGNIPGTYDFMLRLVDLSKTGVFVILGVIFIRFLLRKAPKKYSYFLWIVVAIRLLFPFSIESIFSVFNVEKVITPIFENETIISEVLTYTQPLYYENRIHEYLAANLNSDAYPITWGLTDCFFIWIVGILVILVYIITSYSIVHNQVKYAIQLEENVYECETVKSPFIFGMNQPRIYIPYHLDEKTKEIVLNHEKYHLHRKDYLLRIFALFVAILYWFNPFVWVAYHLFIQDMEMSCDEYVLTGINENKAYSYTLLSMASDQHFAMPKPLAFGEKSISKRIKNILKWKTPNKKTMIISLILCLFTLVSFTSNPTRQDTLSDLLMKYNIDTIDTLHYQTYELSWQTYLDDWVFIHRFNEYFDLVQVSKLEVEPTNETIDTSFTFKDGLKEVTFSFPKSYDICIVETNEKKTAYRVLNHDVAKNVLSNGYSTIGFYATWRPNENYSISARFHLDEIASGDAFTNFEQRAFITIDDSGSDIFHSERCDYILEDNELYLNSKESSNVYVFDIKKDRYEIYMTFNENKSNVDSKEMVDILKMMTFTTTFTRF